jgi:hypothetical protein
MVRVRPVNSEDFVDVFAGAGTSVGDRSVTDDSTGDTVAPFVAESRTLETCDIGEDDQLTPLRPGLRSRLEPLSTAITRGRAESQTESHTSTDITVESSPDNESELMRSPDPRKARGWARFKELWAKGKSKRLVNSMRRESVKVFCDGEMTTQRSTMKELLIDCKRIINQEMARREREGYIPAPLKPVQRGRSSQSIMQRSRDGSVHPASCATPRRGRNLQARRPSIEMDPFPEIRNEQTPSEDGSKRPLPANTAVRQRAAREDRRSSMRMLDSAGGGGGPGGGPISHSASVLHHQVSRQVSQSRPGRRQGMVSQRGPGLGALVKSNTRHSVSLAGTHRASSRRKASVLEDDMHMLWGSMPSVKGPTGLSAGAQSLNSQKDLHVRDLRVISPATTTHNRPAFMARNDAIIVKLEHVRAVILHNTVFMLGLNTDEAIGPFKEKFCGSAWKQRREAMGQDNGNGRAGQPFEHFALEVLLGSVQQLFTTELSQIQAETQEIRASHDRQKVSKKALSPAVLDALRVYLNRFSELCVRVDEVCNTLATVLDEDADLETMCLSQEARVSEGEELLESRLHLISNINHSVVVLMDQLSDVQTAFQLQLDFFSNRFVWSSFTFRIINLVFTFGAMWTAILGMNISVSEREGEEPGWDPIPQGDELWCMWRKASDVFITTLCAIVGGCLVLCSITLYAVSRFYVG